MFQNHKSNHNWANKSSAWQHGAAQVSDGSVRFVLGLMAALLLAAIVTVNLLPSNAFAVTEEEVNAAQAEYDAAEAQLNEIANEYSNLCVQQSETLAKIESTQAAIAQLELDMATGEQRLKELQVQLGEIAVRDYMSNDVSYLQIILSSNSLDELISSYGYVRSIYESKAKLINEADALKKDMEEKKASLEKDVASLERLKADQEKQMEDMKAKQQQTQEILNGLSEEVKALSQQYNSELYARASQAASQGDYSLMNELTGGGSLGAVIAACYSTPSPGYNWCAAWVTNVFRNAGVGTIWGDACDMYNQWCFTSDRSQLQPGMIIASSSTACGMAGLLYGHVGIYIGNNMVMENIGSITTTDLDTWIRTYGTLVTPRWGWLGGVVLS